MIGSFSFVIEAGFFNGIVYSFKRFRKSTKEGSFFAQYDDLDDTKEIHEEYVVKKQFTMTRPFLYVGLLMVVGTTIISYVFLT